MLLKLNITQRQQIAQVGALLGGNFGGQDLCLCLLADDLAFCVDAGEERGRGGLGGGAQRAVEIAEGAGGGELGVGDAGASELE